jgi:ER membrane protein complex subunit 1
VVKINNQLINLNDKDNNIVLKPTATAYIDAQTLGKGVVLQATYGEQQKLAISAFALKTGQAVDDINVVAHYPESLGEPQIVGVQCKNRNDAQGQACRILMATDDGAIVMLQQSKIKWIREESLTNIVAVDFLDLTLSDAEGRIEEELNNKDGNNEKKNVFFVEIIF